PQRRGSVTMSQDPTFRDLIRRVRARDQEAAAELVRRYEPAIRIAVRVRLKDLNLRRLLDSMDICQSVLGNFFVRAASGQFDLDEAEPLLRLLTTMARNKVPNLAVKEQTARRGKGRVHSVADEDVFVDPGPSPSQVVANQELLEAFRSRLSAEE